MSLLILCLLAFTLAFLGSVPIAGPVAVMVVSRGVEGRFTEARKVGIGSALAEGIWAALAFATFATFFARYPVVIPISRVVTSVLLLVLGVQFVRWVPKALDAKQEPPKRGAAALGFLTSLLNPTIFVTWSATATVIESRHFVEMRTAFAVPFGLAAAAGIAVWYSTLIALMTRYQSRLPRRLLTWVVRATGMLLLGIALWTASGVVRSLIG